MRRGHGGGGLHSDWPCGNGWEQMPRLVTRKLQDMSGKAGTGGVKVAAEIGGMLGSGNEFASELVNSGGLGEMIG